MDLKLLKRRVEMLDAVGTGLHPSAVVGQLAEKYGVIVLLGLRILFGWSIVRIYIFLETSPA